MLPSLFVGPSKMKAVCVRNMRLQVAHLFNRYTFNPKNDVLFRNNIRCLTVEKNGIADSEFKFIDPETIKSFDSHFQMLNSSVKKLNKISIIEIEKILDKVSKEGCTKEQGVQLLQCSGELLPDLAPVKKAELTLSAWKIVKNVGPVTLEHYQAYLSSLAASQHNISVDDVLGEIRQSGLEPDEYTYLKMLQCVCEVGDTVQATKIVALMKDAGFPANQAIFNAVIIGHGRVRDLKSIEAAVTMMRNALIALGPDTYTAILRSAAEAGNNVVFNSYFTKYSTELSDKQRLDIVKSLSVGKLYKEIPKVLRGGIWNVTDTQRMLMNVVLELVHMDQLDAAFLLINSLPDCIPTNPNSEASFALFFIQEMVKANTPVEKIVNICDALHCRNPFSLLKATETALQYSPQEIAIHLLNILVERGYRLRPHYFWPLFIAAGRLNNEAEIFNVLELMLGMDVKPDHETLAEWVFVHCNLSQPFELVRKLQDRSLSVASILSPLVTALLFSGQLKNAALVCEKYNGPLEWKKLFKPLATEFFKTKDVSSLSTLLGKMKNEMVGNEILHYSVLQKRVPIDPEALSMLFQAVENAGFHVSFHVSDIVKGIVNGQRPVNTNNSNLLHQIMLPKKMGIEDLEAHLIELKGKGMNTRGTLRLLLQRHCRNRNSARALEIKKEMDDAAFEISSGMMSSLMDVYISGGRLEDAKECLLEIERNNPGFKVDSYKIVDLANLLVKSGKYTSAVDSLKKQQHIKPDASFLRNCIQLLNTVADVEGPERTKEMFDLLIRTNYCSISNKILGPLVHAHLTRNDMENAVKVFSECAAKYKCTPMLHKVLCALVNKIARSSENLADKTSAFNAIEEKDKHILLLNKVIDVMKEAHGLEKSNVSLLIAFAQNGLTKQMKKLIIDSSFKLNMAYMIRNCQRIADENKMETLRNIISVIEHLPNVKISIFYGVLLRLYIRRGDCDGALSLWTELQEKNTNVDESFVSELKSFMMSNKREVTFVNKQSKATDRICNST